MARWKVRDALLAYRSRARKVVAQRFMDEQLVAAVLAPWSKDVKFPEVPPLLQDFTEETDDGADA